MKNEQELYNEIMNEAFADEDVRLKELNRKNVRLFKALLNVKGFAFVSGLLKDFHESECSGEITIVNKPRGENQKDYWGATKGVFVEQYEEGWEGDSFWGYIYFPIKKGKYLRCHYAC